MEGATPATAAVAATAKGSLHPEVRNDSQPEKEKDDTKDSADNGADGDEDNNSDESGDEDGDGDESEGDGDEEDSEDEDQPGNSGKALSGHGKKSSAESSSKIPVASISVAVACLIGICAFLIYLGKKRKRERVRAAWVESVFGSNGSTTQGGPSPGPYKNSTMNSAMTGRMMSGISHHSGTGYQQQQQQQRNNNNLYDDRDSMTSDTQTERERERGGAGMVDRRQSTASTVAGVAATPMSATAGGIGTRRESTMSRTIHNSVMLPAPVVRGGSYGVNTATAGTGTPTWGEEYFNMQDPEPQQHNDGYHHQYEEFFDQEKCGADAAEMAPQMAINYSTPGPGIELATPPTRATGVQRPAVAVYSKNSKGVRTSVHPHHPGGSPFDQPTTTTTSMSNSNGGKGSGGNEYYNTDPSQDRREHLHHHHHQHHHQHHQLQQQRYSMHTSSTAAAGGGHRASDYRRPHSFAAGSQGGIGGVGRGVVVDVEPRTLFYRTHVLDESSDQESITDNEVAAVVASSSAATSGTERGGGNSSTMGKMSGNLLKDHFKRLSSPYVKAIRDQQQQQVTSPASLSCIEERFPQKDVDLMNGGGNGGGNGYENSIPVPGLASGSERRWSRALSKGVGGGSHRRDSCGDEIGVIEELSEDEHDYGVSRGEKNSGHGHFRGHRQVHSGSLASFRGLDDPSNPRLRVMNPDDGVS
ncbi:hypothetical protein BGZ96_005303 [Linnemannia gamsii]|uniref:Uncharacterized protein n=1 Tax=Linnemannia gamsii TaxID=64522 RepID=A0ABQ7K6R3_9FUNG|nr:hypothetical protein BGZ96_005303 [Linnemannia gamsii]